MWTRKPKASAIVNTVLQWCSLLFLPSSSFFFFFFSSNWGSVGPLNRTLTLTPSLPIFCHPNRLPTKSLYCQVFDVVGVLSSRSSTFLSGCARYDLSCKAAPTTKILEEYQLAFLHQLTEDTFRADLGNGSAAFSGKFTPQVPQALIRHASAPFIGTAISTLYSLSSWYPDSNLDLSTAEKVINKVAFSSLLFVL